LLCVLSGRKTAETGEYTKKYLHRAEREIQACYKRMVTYNKLKQPVKRNPY